MEWIDKLSDILIVVLLILLSVYISLLERRVKKLEEKDKK